MWVNRWLPLCTGCLFGTLFPNSGHLHILRALFDLDQFHVRSDLDNGDTLSFPPPRKRFWLHSTPLSAAIFLSFDDGFQMECQATLRQCIFRQSGVKKACEPVDSKGSTAYHYNNVCIAGGFAPPSSNTASVLSPQALAFLMRVMYVRF